jgi:AcrR family transcriptional regulator
MSRTPKSQATAQVADGRRRRGLDNRARIVAAMLEIVQGGEVAPGAEQVAQRADVGLRTVFRHFRDMDALYREMSVEIERELMALAGRPFKADDWRERVIELVERRAYAFEKIAPYLRASAITRHRSKFLAADHDRLVTIAREILKAQLPTAAVRDHTLVEALDLLLSFETWARLRDDQNLSSRRAREVIEAAVRKLID